MFACWCANEACQIYGCMRARDCYGWKQPERPPTYTPLPIIDEIECIKKTMAEMERKLNELIKISGGKES